MIGAGVNDLPYVFYTATEIPIEGFTKFGLHAKPNSTNPIGHFGTGLKMAIAVIIRNGGKIRLVIRGTEYVFYVKEGHFRGTTFNSIHMKRRRDIFGIPTGWAYFTLPFTTELGKNWSLWQAYRELESNTRDENGFSGLAVDFGKVEFEDWKEIGDTIGQQHLQELQNTGTYFEVICPGFNEIAANAGEVFLDHSIAAISNTLYSDDFVTIYDAPSKYLYYRGVRVYDLQYPARFTYDFAQGRVELSEDRSASNIWYLLYKLAETIQHKIGDPDLIERFLSPNKDGSKFFEGHTLSYQAETDRKEAAPAKTFQQVLRRVAKAPGAPQSIVVTAGYYDKIEDDAKLGQVKLSKDQWRTLFEELSAYTVSIETSTTIRDAINQQVFNGTLGT